MQNVVQCFRGTAGSSFLFFVFGMAPLCFSSEVKSAVLERISSFSQRALIGRLISCSRIKRVFRD